MKEMTVSGLLPEAFTPEHLDNRWKYANIARYILYN